MVRLETASARHHREGILVEQPDVADAAFATPAEVRTLVERQELPAEASAMHDRLSPGTAPSGGDTERLLTTAADIVSVSADPGPATLVAS